MTALQSGRSPQMEASGQSTHAPRNFPAAWLTQKPDPRPKSVQGLKNAGAPCSPGFLSPTTLGSQNSPAPNPALVLLHWMSGHCGSEWPKWRRSYVVLRHAGRLLQRNASTGLSALSAATRTQLLQEAAIFWAEPAVGNCRAVTTLTQWGRPWPAQRRFALATL